MNITDTAIRLALTAHFGATNKFSGEPYILHPHRVAISTDTRFPGDQELVAIAWLHDTIEDTDLTYEQIRFELGTRVADAVLMLTKVNGMSGIEYIERVLTNSDAAKVKVQDTLDNFSRNYSIDDEATRLRMAKKYSYNLDMLKDFR